MLRHDYKINVIVKVKPVGAPERNLHQDRILICLKKLNVCLNTKMSRSCHQMCVLGNSLQYGYKSMFFVV